jgi:hypothetical protein
MAALDVQSSNSPPDIQKFNIQDHLKKQTPSPHQYGLPPALRAAFGFALAIARTKALDWLAYASASRLDPTPAVTVGRLQTLRVFRNALCVPAVLEKIKSKIKKKKVTQRYFLILI